MKKINNNRIKYSLVAVMFSIFCVAVSAQKSQLSSETPPLFPGGNDSLLFFIYSNLQYPDSAFNENIEGKVVCGFVIDSIGTVSNPIILKSAHPILDAEAIRIVLSMPNWIPATRNNTPIKSNSAVTVFFDVEKEFERAEKMEELIHPEFPGGVNGMIEFLAKNIKYPKDAQRKSIQGRVICTFVVKKDGTINDITIEQGVYDSLDEEAVRIISIMPKWIPGRIKNRIVNVRYTLPVVFRLQ